MDTVNVNNTITALPTSFNSIVWTDSTVIETADAVLWDGAAWLVGTLSLGAITNIPAYRSPLWDAFSYTYRDEKILFNGTQWAEVSELYLGVVSELPATYTSTLWQDNTYEIITSPIIDLPDIPPMIDQKIEDHNLAEPSHPFILEKIYDDLNSHNVSPTAHEDIRTKIDTDIAAHDADTASHPFLLDKIDADIAAHNVSATAHDDIRTKIDTDLAAHDGANTAQPYIRQRITDDIAAHNNDNAAHSQLVQYFDREIIEGIDAHNASTVSHADIRANIIAVMNAHNTDPQEDQHPLLRALIEARMPVLPTVDGEYKLVVSGGIASWQTI